MKKANKFYEKKCLWMWWNYWLEMIELKELEKLEKAEACHRMVLYKIGFNGFKKVVLLLYRLIFLSANLKFYDDFFD